MKKWRFFLYALLVSSSLALALNASAATKAKYTLTFGGDCKRDNSTGDGLVLFRELLAKYSNGQISLDIQLNGELCSGKACIEQLDQKAVEMAHASVGNYAPFSNTLGASALPYLWDSIEAWQQAIGGPLGETVSQIVEKKDKRKLIAIFAGGGYRHLWTNEPVRTPADLKEKNMKIRTTPSAIEAESIKAWGGIPTTVPWGELYQALQSKLITGHLLQKIHADLFKAYEASPYCTEIGYIVQQENIFMNLQFFNGLPEDMRNAILRAAREAQAHSFTRDLDYDKAAEERMMKMGVKFYKPNENEMKLWKDAVYKELWPKHRTTVDQEILNLILKAQNKTVP